MNCLPFLCGQPCLCFTKPPAHSFRFFSPVWWNHFKVLNTTNEPLNIFKSWFYLPLLIYFIDIGICLWMGFYTWIDARVASMRLVSVQSSKYTKNTNNNHNQCDARSSYSGIRSTQQVIRCRFKSNHYLSCQLLGKLSNSLRQCQVHLLFLNYFIC